MAGKAAKSSKKSSKPTPPKSSNVKKSAEKKSQQENAALKKREKAKKIQKQEVITLAVMNKARLNDLGHDKQVDALLDNLKTGFRAVGYNAIGFEKS